MDADMTDELKITFKVGYRWGNFEYVRLDAFEKAVQNWCAKHPGSSYELVKDGAEITANPADIQDIKYAK